MATETLLINRELIKYSYILNVIHNLLPKISEI